MKVLLLAAGNSVHTGRWVNAMIEAGLDVALATQHDVTVAIDPRCRIHSLPYGGGAGYFLNTGALRRILNAEQPDLLHAHYASGYGTLARLVRYRPALLSVWGSDVYSFPYKSPLHRWWLRGNLRAATRVASTSRAMAKQTRVVAPWLENIAITPFGVDLDIFVASGPRSAASGNQLVIGTVKTLSPVYGIDMLIHAFAALRQAMAASSADAAGQLRLRIVGDGEQLAELQALADTLGVREVTEFLPAVPHSRVPDELGQLDVYVALSRRESFGVAVIEAGAAGLPVVVSDAGGLPELVRDGETGFVVPKEDVAAAAAALQKLVLDSSLRRQLGRAGRDHVLATYEWRESVRIMLALYEDLLAQARQGAGQ